MSRVDDLAALQELEQALSRATARLGEIRRLRAEPPELLAAREEAAAAQENLASLQRKLRATEVEATSTRQKRQAGQERLYGGSVTNPRELTGLEREAESLSRRLQQLEDQILELMLGVEEATETSEAKTRHLTDLEQRHSQRRAQLEAEGQELQAEAARLRQDLQRLRGALPADLLGRYDSLKARKGGRAIAPLQRGVCQACGVQVPTHVAQRAQQSEELVPCPSCGRFLWPR